MADLGLWVNDSILSNFADDTQSIIIADTEEEAKSITMKESSKVIEHFGANNLVNNADKAAVIYISKEN